MGLLYVMSPAQHWESHMASGRTHGTVTLALTIPTGFAIYSIGGAEAGLAAATGCLVGLFIDPDLDISNRTRSEARVLRMFPALGWLWMVLWWPYAKAIPHRHPLSHWPIIGTAGRLLYLSVILFLALMGLEVAFGIGAQILEALLTVPYEIWASFAFGLAVSDVGHWLFDQF